MNKKTKEKTLAEIADILRPEFSGSEMDGEAGYDVMKRIEKILNLLVIDWCPDCEGEMYSGYLPEFNGQQKLAVWICRSCERWIPRDDNSLVSEDEGEEGDEVNRVVWIINKWTHNILNDVVLRIAMEIVFGEDEFGTIPEPPTELIPCTCDVCRAGGECIDREAK